MGKRKGHISIQQQKKLDKEDFKKTTDKLAHFQSFQTASKILTNRLLNNLIHISHMKQWDLEVAITLNNHVQEVQQLIQKCNKQEVSMHGF